MLGLIPAPLHRAGLRGAFWLRRHWRRVVRPRLAGVSVLACDAQGRLLLVRHSYGSGAWSLPGGGRQRREDPEATARREMREELVVELDELRLLACLEETISGAPHTAHVFAALLRGEVRPDGREVIAARLFAVGELPEDVSAATLRRIALWQEARGD